MASPSYAPSRDATSAPGTDDPSVRARPALRLSRMPVAHANITMPLVKETFRHLGAEALGRPDNDALTEDELFAIWQARLF
jgi:hypothetical protein